MSYSEYLIETGKEDNKRAWIDWKTDICGMSFNEAKRAANDPDWGYSPIPR